MGRYLSLDFQFDGTHSLARVLGPLFSNDFFEPVAVGGIDAHEGGDNWFLGGYALEDFLSRFLDKGIPKPLSIELAAQQDGEERGYLLSVAGWLSRLQSPSRQLSTFEKVDPITQVTFLGDTRLGTSVLEELDRWIARFPKGVLYVY